MDKFGLIEGIFDALEAIKKGYKGYILNGIMGLVIILLPALFFELYLTKSIIVFYLDKGINLKLVVTVGLVSFIIVFLKGVVIKMTDDLIDKRETTYLNQVKFVRQRFLTILVSTVIISVPSIILMYLIGLRLSNGDSAVIFNLIMLIYLTLTVMIHQSIIIEGLNPIGAMKRSISIMSKNFFKYFLIMVIGYFISSMSQTVFNEAGNVLNSIKLSVDYLILLYFLIVTTALFKQVSDTPRN